MLNKKLKYISVIFLLLFARGCDFYSTSLWIFQENGMAQESNPLAKYFGVGWNGLVLANIFVVILIAYCYYYYTFKYKASHNLKMEPRNAFEYASILYYEKKGQLWKLFYKMPINKNVALSHTGYIMIWAVIFSSFFAAIHNLLQFYDNKFYYALYLKGYSSIIYYNILFAPMIFFSIKLIHDEFSLYKNNLSLKN